MAAPTISNPVVRVLIPPVVVLSFVFLLAYENGDKYKASLKRQSNEASVPEEILDEADALAIESLAENSKFLADNPRYVGNHDRGDYPFDQYTRYAWPADHYLGYFIITYHYEGDHTMHGYPVTMRFILDSDSLFADMSR